MRFFRKAGFATILALILFEFACRKEHETSAPHPEQIHELSLTDTITINNPMLYSIAWIVGADNVRDIPKNRKVWDKVAGLGYGLWDKAIITGGGDDVEYVVPFSVDGKNISGLLVCQKYETSFKYKIIPGTLLKNTFRKLNSDEQKQTALLVYMSNRVFGTTKFDLPGSIFKDNGHDDVGRNLIIKDVLANSQSNVTARWDYIDVCLLFNSNCTCPSDWSSCDMCSECVELHCWGSWVEISDDPLDNPAPGEGDGGGGGGGGAYANITTQLSNIRQPGESFWFDQTINPNFALVFGTAAQFETYLNGIRNNITYDLTLPSIPINQEENIERARFNMNFVGGVDVHLKTKKVGNLWTVDNVTSDTWGFTPAVTWAQNTSAQTLAGNEITVKVVGYMKYNLVLEGFGTLWSQEWKFQIKINNITGKITSISRL